MRKHKVTKITTTTKDISIVPIKEVLVMLAEIEAKITAFFFMLTRVPRRVPLVLPSSWIWDFY